MYMIMKNHIIEGERRCLFSFSLFCFQTNLCVIRQKDFSTKIDECNGFCYKIQKSSFSFKERVPR